MSQFFLRIKSFNFIEVCQDHDEYQDEERRLVVARHQVLDASEIHHDEIGDDEYQGEYECQPHPFAACEYPLHLLYVRIRTLHLNGYDTMIPVGFSK